MKYRKKPVIIEAYQWMDQVSEDWPLWLDHADEIRIDYSNRDKPVLKVSTLEGVMTAQYGDFIIQGIKGELYPCKPDIFDETYETV